MNGSHVVYLVIALLFAARGAELCFRLAGRRANDTGRREANIRTGGTNSDFEHDLAHLNEAYLEKRHGVRKGDLPSHMEAAAAYVRILRTRWLRDKSGPIGAAIPDRRLTAMLTDCMRLAKTPEQRRAVERLRRAASPDQVASNGTTRDSTDRDATRSHPK